MGNAFDEAANGGGVPLHARDLQQVERGLDIDCRVQRDGAVERLGGAPERLLDAGKGADVKVRVAQIDPQIGVIGYLPHGVLPRLYPFGG
jgi:hypothetical protein